MMLTVRDLKVSFRTEHGTVPAVDGISFDLEQGEVLGLLGESGSGKTLSLLAVMGLLNDPNAIITGSVMFKGQELIGLTPAQMAKLRGKDLAMIFQNPMAALTPVYSIGWQIAEQIRQHQKVSAKAARARAIELLHEVNIPNAGQVVDRFPHQLSGGMRQRALIAMALSGGPSLLVADEPTTALDVTVQAQIIALLKRLGREHGSSIIFITHDMGVIAEIADKVMVMYAGRIVERAATRTIFAAPQHPYTRALMDSIPALTGVIPHRLKTISGAPPGLHNLPIGCAFGPRCPRRQDRCVTRPTLAGDAAHMTACYFPELAE